MYTKTKSSHHSTGNIIKKILAGICLAFFVLVSTTSIALAKPKPAQKSALNNPGRSSNNTSITSPIKTTDQVELKNLDNDFNKLKNLSDRTIGANKINKENLQTTTGKLLRETVQDTLKWLLYFVALSYGIYHAIRMVVAETTDEMKKQRLALAYAIMGFFIVNISDTIVNNFWGSSGSGETILTDAGRQNTINTIMSVVNVLLYLLGSIAILMIIWDGFQMISTSISTSDPGKFKNYKSRIIYSVGGLIIISIAQPIVSSFIKLDKDKGAIAGSLQKKELIGLINFALSFVGVIAFILIIYAGYLWLTAGADSGQVEKAKKIVYSAIAGIVVILSSFTIINTFL